MTKHLRLVVPLCMVVLAVSMVALGTAGSSHAGTFQVSARNPVWQSTGAEIHAGEVLEFTAEGTVVHWKSLDKKQKQTCGPDGVSGPTDDDAFLVPGLAKMGLVGMISDQTFDIGSGCTITAPATGILHLGINDTNRRGGCADNEGSWHVEWSVSSPRSSARSTPTESPDIAALDRPGDRHRHAAKLSYSPPFVPLSISVNSDGKLDVAFSGRLITPAGTLCLESERIDLFYLEITIADRSRCYQLGDTPFDLKLVNFPEADLSISYDGNGNVRLVIPEGVGITF